MSAILYMTPSGKVPLQGGKPVFISWLEYSNCCCDGCLEGCLKTAYNEHTEVLGQPVVACPSYSEIRTWMEGYCTKFIDHVNGPLNVSEDAFLYFTLETWREAANISGTWDYGDEAKGFAALKWLPYLRYVADARSLFPGSILGTTSWHAQDITELATPYHVIYGTTDLAFGTGSYVLTDIQMDERISNPWGSDDCIQMGKRGDTFRIHQGAIVLRDATNSEGTRTYSLDITFNDTPSIAEIYGARLERGRNYFDATVSFSASEVQTQTSLYLSPALFSYCWFDFFPVLKPPFTECT